MKRTNPIYFFIMFLGLFLFLGIMLMLFVADSRYIYLIGFVLFFVIVIVIVSIALSNGTLKRRSIYFKECVGCKEEIEGNSIYCKYCGINQGNTVTCDFCGEENKEDATVCEHCEALLK